MEGEETLEKKDCVDAICLPGSGPSAPSPANLPFHLQLLPVTNILSLNAMAEEDFVMVEHQHPGSPYLRSISAYVDDINDELRRVSIEIHDHPELQYKEFHAHEILTKYLEEQKGWHVTPSAYDIKTAFVAVYDSGKTGPVVSLNAEYDALKGIGHACGHNLIAVASVGGALATARAIKEHDLGGKVVLFGTPAEGKCIFQSPRRRTGRFDQSISSAAGSHRYQCG